jgi:hypothetical protein
LNGKEGILVNQNSEGFVRFIEGANQMSEEWKTIRPEKLFVVFGFVLMAVSPFLPWITAYSVFLSVSRTGLELSPETGMFAILFLVIGSLVAWFYNNFKRAGIACLLMSGLMMFETIWDYQQLQDRFNSYSTNMYVRVSIDTGFYLLVVGVFVSIVGSLLLLRLSTKVKPKETALPSPPLTPQAS